MRVNVRVGLEHTHPDSEVRVIISTDYLTYISLTSHKEQTIYGSYILLIFIMYISWLSVEEQFLVSEPETQSWI